MLLMSPLHWQDVLGCTRSTSGNTFRRRCRRWYKDAFLMTIPPGQSLIAHTSGQHIDLVSFDIATMPQTGMLEILLNTDPIATTFGGALDSFYQSNMMYEYAKLLFCISSRFGDFYVFNPRS